MNVDRERIVKFISPLVYALIFPVTVYFTFAVFYHAPPIILASEISFFGVPVIVFSAVYVIYGLLLLLLERPATVGIVDHLRRSLLMYAGLPISISIALLQPFSSSDSEDYWLFWVLGVFFMCAIVVDFSILFIAKRFVSHISSRHTSARSSA